MSAVGRQAIGEILRRHRLTARLTQRELADRSGLSLRALRDLERGRVRAPREQSISRLADALGLSDLDRRRLCAVSGTLPLSTPVTAVPLDAAVLGCLRLCRGGAEIKLPSPMLRNLFGTLAIQPGTTVSHAEMIDVLWGDRPPRSHRRLLSAYGRQLRDLVEGNETTPDRMRIVPARAGWRLEIDEDDLDLLRFDALSEQGRRAYAGGDHDAAVDPYARALDCWRGPVLADLDPRLRQHPAAVAVEDRRIAVALALADLATGLGHYERAVAALRPVMGDHPLHEGICARLMLALAGTGQQAGALSSFAELRDRLAQELGIEPGPELQRAYVRVLRQDLPPTAAGGFLEVKPMQLPPDLSMFTGRDTSLRQLDELLSDGIAGPPTASFVAVIAGTAGVGKTALAVHWSYRVRDRFPDGQLHVNLRGYAQHPPLRAIEGLTGFLRALGIPTERIPTDVDAAVSLYRSVTAGKNLLAVLDNAHEPAQVRPLLLTSPGCVTLITSRDRLTGLLSHEGARRLTLDVFPPDEAHRLLTRVLDKQRVAAEPAAVADLAAASAYLPLALRVAAANLADHPTQRISDYVAELRGADRLAALESEGDDQSAVRAAFDLSYARLDPEAQRMFRLLGLVPGPDFDARAAAALAHRTPQQARRLLDRLGSGHLLVEHAAGRYTCHDLLRLYATKLLDGDAERAAAMHRLCDYYLRTAEAATRLLYPETLRLALPPAASGVPSVRFTGETEALAWLEAERANLVAIAQHAVSRGPTAIAWRLADVLRAYFWLRMYSTDWLAVGQAGLAAAEADGELLARAAMHRNLADFHNRHSRHGDAIHHYERALALARQAGWMMGEANIRGNLGGAYWQAGQLTLAADAMEQALAISRQTGWLAGQAVNLGNLGIVYRELGQLVHAAELFSQSLDLDRQLGSRVGEAIALGNLGDTYQLMGRLEDAAAHLRKALTIHRLVGNRGGESNVLRGLAAVYRDAGDLDAALEAGQAGLALARETGERRFESLALNTLGTVHHRLGRPRVGAALLNEALPLARLSGHRYCEAEALLNLSAIALDRRHHRSARQLAAEALAISRQCGYALLEQNAATRLGALDRDPA
jgi:DNA-binding SARP family transcriptional activator/tetratricopeptide (TPR) repeat protein